MTVLWGNLCSQKQCCEYPEFCVFLTQEPNLKPQKWNLKCLRPLSWRVRGFKAMISKLVRGRAHIENNITNVATDSWIISLYSLPIFFNSVREMRLRTSTVDLWMTLWFRGPTHWGAENPPITHSQLSIPQVLCSPCFASADSTNGIDIYYWEIASFKWTHAIQTHVIPARVHCTFYRDQSWEEEPVTRVLSRKQSWAKRGSETSWWGWAVWDQVSLKEKRMDYSCVILSLSGF